MATVKAAPDRRLFPVGASREGLPGPSDVLSPVGRTPLPRRFLELQPATVSIEDCKIP
jgi:hypothetical protein